MSWFAQPVTYGDALVMLALSIPARFVAVIIREAVKDWRGKHANGGRVPPRRTGQADR